MKKAHRQPKFSTTSAPSVGPKAPATAPIAPQIATATGTFSLGKVCSTRASDDGTSAAAPTACRTRAATRNPAVGARPHSIEARVNTTTAVRNVRRRPTRSARRPAGISKAAKTIVYAFSTHDSEEALTPLKSARIAGNATNRIVVSRKTAKIARLVETSTVHGLRVVVVRTTIDYDAVTRESLVTYDTERTHLRAVLPDRRRTRSRRRPLDSPHLPRARAGRPPLHRPVQGARRHRTQPPERSPAHAPRRGARDDGRAATPCRSQRLSPHRRRTRDHPRVARDGSVRRPLPRR